MWCINENQKEIRISHCVSYELNSCKCLECSKYYRPFDSKFDCGFKIELIIIFILASLVFLAVILFVIIYFIRLRRKKRIQNYHNGRLKELDHVADLILKYKREKILDDFQGHISNSHPERVRIIRQKVIKEKNNIDLTKINLNKTEIKNINSDGWILRKPK